MKKRLKIDFRQFLMAIATIVIALVIGAVLIAVSGNDPKEAYGMLLKGAFSSKTRFSEVLNKMIPLTLMAMGLSIAYKTQLWNIGADGQFTIGAVISIIPGIYLGLPPVLMLPLSLLLAAIGGGLWSGLAGWLKNRFNANEVITTLMLNYIAFYLLSFLVYGPMMDPGGGGFPQSELIREEFQLPRFIPSLRVHTGIYAAVLISVLMFFFWKTKNGVKIELVGQGEKIATYAGIHVKRTILLSMFLSGALCGIAGWTEVYGVQNRLLDGISSGYGNTATIIALLGGLNPLGIVVSSFFFSVLLAGSATMQRMTDVPYSVVDIIEGLIIVFVITRSAIQFKRPARKAKKGA